MKFKHKKARNVNCGLFRHCRRIYLVSLATYLVGWGNLNESIRLLYLLIKIEFKFLACT